MWAKTYIILFFSILMGSIASPRAEASIAWKLTKFVLKPVTMPLNFAKHKATQVVSGTAHAGIRTVKGGLSNISVQAGPFISVRPFDFR